MFGLESFLENSIFGLIIDEDNDELDRYDESLVTSVLETGPDCEGCDEDSLLPDDDDVDSFDWDDDDFEENILDDIENTRIYDEFDSNYRTYF